MSEVQLVVREAGRDWSGHVHGSSADRVIAALSADPETLAELEVACGRFAKAVGRRFLGSLSPGLIDEPHDAGIVILDLVARLVVVDSTYSSPGPTGHVEYHDGQRATEIGLGYHLDEDWLFIRDHLQWRGLADERRRERAAHPPLDVRQVLFGRPLVEFIGREIFGNFAGRAPVPVPENPDWRFEHPEAKAVIQIHAAWLLTPREDLGGRCPREVALERRSHLSWDLEHQAERWSLVKSCPPGLDKSSAAFRHGGLGTHELVMYYELVRELLWSCRDQVVAGAARPSETSGDFLTREVPRLERVAEEWLDRPDLEYHGRTPRRSSTGAPGCRKGCRGVRRSMIPIALAARCWPTCPGPCSGTLTAAAWRTSSPSTSTAARARNGTKNNASGRSAASVLTGNKPNVSDWA